MAISPRQRSLSSAARRSSGARWSPCKWKSILHFRFLLKEKANKILKIFIAKTPFIPTISFFICNFSIYFAPVLWFRIRIQWGPWIRFRIQEGKMIHKHRKKCINFIFWSAGCSLLTAEGFSCSFVVFHGGNYWSEKICLFFSFWSSKPWIRIHLKCCENSLQQEIYTNIPQVKTANMLSEIILKAKNSLLM